MKTNRTRIDDMRTAFDEVIPGYADAWNKAMLDAARGPLNRRSRRWDTRRKYLRREEERCLLPYRIQRHGPLESFGLPTDPDAMLIQNRGYVPLMVVWFAQQQEAAKALHAMRDPNIEAHRRRWTRERKEPYEPTSIDSFYWTNDSTDFEHRCRIALEVLRYVRDNGTRIEPVWRQCTPQQLIQQS